MTLSSCDSAAFLYFRKEKLIRGFYCNLMSFFSKTRSKTSLSYYLNMKVKSY